MGIWHQRIRTLEKEHGDSRVAAFKKRHRFRHRYERQGFNAAHDRDSGATSAIIRALAEKARYLKEAKTQKERSQLETQYAPFVEKDAKFEEEIKPRVAKFYPETEGRTLSAGRYMFRFLPTRKAG